MHACMDYMILYQAYYRYSIFTLAQSSGRACMHALLQVHVVDVSKIRRDPEYASATSVGTVDVWEKYLVIGFPNIQIIDLNTQERRALGISTEHEVGKTHCSCE